MCRDQKDVDGANRGTDRRRLHGFSFGHGGGADTWAAQIVLALRENNPALRLHCSLPCFDQGAKWSTSSRERYRSVLEQADSIIFVNRENKRSCLLERDHFLVSHASIVLTVYNGEKRGGTAATVRYARKLGRELIVIDPATPAAYIIQPSGSFSG